MKRKYIAKTKKHVLNMFRLWKFTYGFMTRILILTLMIGINLYGFTAIGSTNAYYNDIETSSDNSHFATSLDFILNSTNWFPGFSLSPGESALKDVTVVNDGVLDFKYTVRLEQIGGDNDYCSVLDLEVLLEGSPYYSGSLLGFTSSQEVFPTSDEWTFNVSLPISETGFEGKVCEFDFIFEGWQKDFSDYPYGFHDIEIDSNLITVKALQCNALSQGYWRNNEGCSQGQGTSDWTLEINDLSLNYSSVFSSITGGGICESLWTPNCSGGNTAESKLCKAEAHTLANELNIVSGRQDTAALLAGADDGSSAFDNLGLLPSSTVGEAIDAIEAILVNPSATIQQLTDADYVAERIYAFYEDENPIGPQCIYDLNDVEINFGQESENSIVLNEFLPNPDGFEYGFDFGTDAGLMPQGEWIEIYNNGGSSFDLDGWYTWDDSGDNSNKVYISTLNTDLGTTIIGSNSWLVVYMNKEILGNTGDTAKLYDDSDVLIDSYTYDLSGDCDLEPTVGGTNDEVSSGTCNAEVPGNKSYARIPDGIGAWVDPIPTPGFVNKTEEEPQVESISTSEGSSVVEVEEVIEEPEVIQEVIIEESYDLIDAIVSLITLQGNEESVEETDTTEEVIEEPVEDVVPEEITEEVLVEEEVVEEQEISVDPIETEEENSEQEITEEPVEDVVPEESTEEVPDILKEEVVEEAPVIVQEEVPEIVIDEVIEDTNESTE